MNKYNIISDIAGRYDELIDLLALMPTAEKIILVGDLVDRGPKSKQVVEFAMSMPNVITLKGNHELMMIEAADGDIMDHVYNGGRATLKSYEIGAAWDYPEEHINWMRTLPLFFKDEGLFVSHAPWLGPMEKTNVGEQFILWNRDMPSEVEGVFQVYGHNSNMYKHDDWGICLDACRDKVLTGMSWPSKEIFQVPYKD
jgi:serine/threonine protein phosphatase 1